MAHLYLPIEHGDADLVLAGQVAQAVAAEELFVVWTRDAGPGAAPRVEAILREAAPPPARRPGLLGLWDALTGRRRR